MSALGMIFEIKRFAVHDGPGIRTTVFFKGCPLKCLWCHNPEGLSYEPEIAFLERKCVHCGECFCICPLGLHTENENGIHLINRSECTLCQTCVRNCMPQALKFYGTEYSADKIFEIVYADIDFYKQSGGGITCSGGEPLMQPDFLAAFLALCKNAGLNTAVDTSGYAKWSSFEKILPFTDIFLFDIKHMDTEAHKKMTGVDNGLIHENLQKLAEYKAAVEIRMPIIPELNDSEKNILQTAAFLKTIKTIKQVRLLPYHALAGSKYSSIGKEHNMPAPSDNINEKLHYVSEILKSEGVPVANLP